MELTLEQPPLAPISLRSYPLVSGTSIHIQRVLDPYATRDPNISFMNPIPDLVDIFNKSKDSSLDQEFKPQHEGFNKATEGYNSLLYFFNKTVAAIPGYTQYMNKSGIITLNWLVPSRQKVYLKGAYYEDMNLLTQTLPSDIRSFIVGQENETPIFGLMRNITGRNESVSVFHIQKDRQDFSLWNMNAEGIEQLHGKGIESEYHQVEFGMKIRV